MSAATPDHYVVPAPDDVAGYDVLSDEELKRVFRFGSADTPLAEETGGAVYLRGHDVTDETATRLAGWLVNDPTQPVDSVQRVSALFTRRPFDGRTPSGGGKTWWATPVAANTPGAIPITVVVWAGEGP